MTAPLARSTAMAASVSRSASGESPKSLARATPMRAPLSPSGSRKRV